MKQRHRRGIYLLPTLFTVGNLFCGYSSLVQSSVDKLELAALLIIVAALLDGLDGRIARLTGSTSAFGVQFDSLADIVSFGVAPALLTYRWMLGPGRIGWTLAFLFVACAAMRLARFNIQTAVADKRYFAGLPTPVAGAVLATSVQAFPQPTRSVWLIGVVALLVVCVATLMVSRLRYRSFRDIDLRNRRSYIYVLPIAAALVGVALNPPVVLFVLCTAYAFSAPTVYVWELRKRRRVTLTPSPGKNEVADEPVRR